MKGYLARRARRSTRRNAVFALSVLVGAPACSTDAPQPAEATAPKPVSTPLRAPILQGTWRATLTSPGGELPFELRVRKHEGELHATAHNADEVVTFSSATRTGNAVVLRIEGYDSEIRATVDERGQTLTGTWTKTTPEGPSSMPFAARRGASERFASKLTKPTHPVPDTVSGDWWLKFTEEDGSTFAGHAILTQTSAGVSTAVHGTILTDTGDYRYLEGRYESGTVELSCFDGGHAFLFRARIDRDGAMQGDFWSRASYHATWSGQPMRPGQPGPLKDPFAAIALSPSETEGRFRFAFPDATGAVVRDDAPRFKGSVVLIDIFGTWCPNCNDYAPLLAGWHRKYGPRGLEVVGLAFEFTGDAKRDRAQLNTYAKTHGIEFPLLLAGTSDKGDAADALPSIDTVESYPTTVLVGRDGRVHKIHSGFAGPATGEHHTELVAVLEAEIEALL